MNRVIKFTRAEDGGTSVIHPAYRGRLATMWIYAGRGGGLVYFDGMVEMGVVPLAAPGDPVPPTRLVSDSDYEIAIAAGAFENDDAFLARLLRDAVPAGSTNVSVVHRSSLPPPRATSLGGSPPGN